MICRHCGNTVENAFLDLGYSPPSNAYLKKDDLKCPEITYPLRVFVCEKCWLVQTEDFTKAEELFKDDYAYFSSTSNLWLEHSLRYCKMIQKRLSLTTRSLVIEVASNDGYLLKNFVMAESECKSLIEKKLSLPAYDQCLKASHLFNLLNQQPLIVGCSQHKNTVLLSH